jgi:hypothetical protein
VRQRPDGRPGTSKSEEIEILLEKYTPTVSLIIVTISILDFSLAKDEG